ncbi:MAG: universal stress protein [Candidatus Binatia bacterium]|nr:universal stress protein [Candidatus Binatia bacterium]
MTSFKRIVVASDLSPRAALAVSRALCVATSHHAHVTVLHVVAEEEFWDSLLRPIGRTPARVDQHVMHKAHAALREQVRSLLSQQGKTSPPNKLRLRVTRGKDFLAIIHYAQAESADLIVLGAHGAHFVRDLFLGATTEKVVRQGDRPVLVVKQPPHSPYQRVLVPVDFSEASQPTLASALQLAPQATFTVLHVYEILHEHLLRRAGVPERQLTRYRQEAAKAAKEQLGTFLRTCTLQGHTVTPMVKYGHPSTVIQTVARQRRADLIAVGTHSRTGFERAFLGSVAEHVLREAQCDVLVVRPPTIPRS